jgi:uncharacterized membrane protein
VSATITYNGTTYDQEVAETKVISAFVGWGLTMVVAFIILVISLIVHTATNSDQVDRWEQDHYSRQFFTAVETDDSSYITDEDLLRFYNDITSNEEDIGENSSALVPDGLDEVQFNEDMYGNMCKYFDRFAVGGGADACYNEGTLTPEFLANYNLAQAGRWRTGDDAPLPKPDEDFTGALGLGPLNFMRHAWLLGMFVALAAAIMAEPSYNRHEPWFVWKKQWPILFTCPGMAALFILNQRDMNEDRNIDQSRVVTKKYGPEIADFKQKLTKLEAIPSWDRDASVNKAIKDLRAVIEDLENFDTALEKETVKYLAKSYASEAKEVKKGMSAHFDALEEVHKIP